MKIRNVIKLLLVVALLCVGATWWYLQVYKKLEPISIGQDDQGIIQDDLAVIGETIESGLRQIGEMNTAEYYFTRTETVEDSKKLDLTSIGIDFVTNIPLTSNSFTYSYDGNIKAGIDFTEIEVSIDRDAKTITVLLPKSRIMSSEVDPDSYKFYEIKNNILNPISPEDYAVSFADLIHKEEERAVEEGLLEKADENAQKILKNFISSYSSDSYSITIKTK
ncbi:MAG: DUF4230 domain-containing protein [Erysipelotrichaceae bacterium]|nr:DUF4230 domain-containing protein [Erysipelotrichaceae bacterium]